ncbi:1-phosphatidylinositol 3-phosphate 5-kinase isoform X15 [Pongo abelii]|uniref:1-phosphatidylinositol 3-phosphate 5-kinase isoform X15 n=1 Tax=Pongo abelii TaxID=9601 RepID=UPI0023E7B748|nr:1-phosphatidylinositol 3-phosphate 5-kinase isoform X9 [Pongo abelii]
MGRKVLKSTCRDFSSSLLGFPRTFITLALTHEMATGDKTSPTLDSANDLPRSPTSPSHLTHFKPLTPDQDEPPFKSAYSSFVNLFRFNKERAEGGQGEQQPLSGSWTSPQLPSRTQSVRSPTPYKKQLNEELQRRSSALDTRRKAEPTFGGHDPRTAVQLRSLSTVLKRLKEIMEGKSQDSDLKQYWMPDSQCKECYDCSEKFTTFRRRHHCRLCGQIFCSRCCNQEIPGKFMGYTGDLRACTYCRKIALSYAHSTDSNSIGEDLNALSDSACSVSVLDPSEPRTPVGSRKASRNIFLEDDLAWQSLIHPDSSNTPLSTRLVSVQEDAGKSPARNRSASITNLSLDRSGSPMVPSYETSVSPQANRTYVRTETTEDERKILLDSVQLKDLWKKICHHSSGMEFQDHRYWLRTHPNCIVGKELVNWLIRNGHIATRAQAIAIGQAMVDGRWLDCVSHHDQLFRDEYALYRPLQSTEFSETPSPDSDSVNSVEGHSEPSWFKDIKFDDSDTEQIAEEGDDNLANSASPSKRTSVSSFQSTVDSDSAASISLNVELDNVNFHIKKPSKYPHVPPHPADQKVERTSFELCLVTDLEKVHGEVKKYLISDTGGQQLSISDAFIKESLFNRRVEEKSKELPFTPLGWHHNNLELLREENGEKQAMERLLSANHNHMMALLQQLLHSDSLSSSWRDIIVSLVCQVVQTVRPDVKNQDDDMDIRQFVHIKKIPGGKKFDSVVVNGFVCTKNIAHKKMNSCIKNPKILLLKCSIEYLYREETKFTCIDPIVLQEREFLKNYVQRIVDVRPTLVLVEKTVSRIAQDMLLEHGITLVINVKSQVLERISRMTQGDLVMSMDQLLTKPHLGTCHKFYMQIFQLPNEQTKTLMFFEGCPQHLGCTIKLRGGSDYELARVDCLNPINHQRLCVLFSSSSAQSSNAPSACVSPWIVTMEFYGKNDLTLGIFLERYCFRPSYQCPSMFCDTPMVHHIRRFVHGQGCVQIILKELDSPVPGYQHTILTYSWCRICKQVTPVVALSNESWSMSFAKYLELRFYGHQYTRRANAEPCGHSIHHDYHQYFSYNQMVASFSYSPIRLLEVCVPLPKIFIKRQAPLKVSLLQDLKDFFQKVSQVYLAIDERLASLKTDTFSKTREEKMEDIFAQKEMEEGEFKNWIEKMQARLMSSSVDTPQQLQSVFESLIAKKQSLCEVLQAWNNRLQDLFQQEKGRKRPSVPPSPGRLRQGEESKISAMDASPRNISPGLQNGEKEDRFLTTLSSQSSTSSTHLQLPTPPEVMSEQSVGGPPELDTASSSEDVFDGHLLGSTDSQVKEKSTMKAIFANLLPGNSYNPIPFPFDPDKHYLMYEHERVPIAVCEKEPSSIIAFALSCKEYRNALEELSKATQWNSAEEGLPTNSTSDSRPKSSSPIRLPEMSGGQTNRTTETEPQPSKKASGMLSFFRGTAGKSPDLSSQKRETLRGADSAYYQVGQTGKEGTENQGVEPQDEVDGGDTQKKQLINPHVELQFSDANAKFYCRLYYAGEFHKMREVILDSSEEDFIRSLSHSSPWQARGGKSGAAFYATEDDRFILKQMPRLEVQSFLDFAPHYFNYITNAVQQKRPTALAKILGVYRIGYKNSQNNTEKKLDLLVMENLFYGRKMAQVFDLKGSLRNRNVKTDTGKESCDVVLLDENLLKMVRDNPLYIRSHSKAVLRTSIHSDSHFLSSHLIIDYSLLVGRDDTSNELVVGIIDYIRTFTWDKKLEMVVKSTGILGGQGKMPTVVSPELYRTRFCEAMDKYFLMVPDHWTGLGLNC